MIKEKIGVPASFPFTGVGKIFNLTAATTLLLSGVLLSENVHAVENEVPLMDKVDLKRLIFPALAALILHGFLISLKLPKQETLNPALSGNPIKIAINTISPPAIVPQKKEELKRTEMIEERKRLVLPCRR
jgi:hypothetical protein